MKQSIRFSILLVLIVGYQNTTSINIITFFIRPYPKTEKIDNDDNAMHKLTIPGKTIGKILKKNYLTFSPEGIFSTYTGYLAISNFNGQIIFPRKHQKDIFKILITEKITPIMMIGATVHHWELNPTVPAQLFVIEREQNPETKEYFWNTTEIDLPENNIISLDTIVIFSKPQNMFIPLGKKLTNKNPQIYLPDMYAKKSINLIARALWLLTIKHFFSPIDYTVKKQSDTYFSKQITSK
ncbi:MAG: hypothetical protein WDZ41_05930 [Candidatus Babeliales bacterium]